MTNKTNAQNLKAVETLFRVTMNALKIFKDVDLENPSGYTFETFKCMLNEYQFDTYDGRKFARYHGYGFNEGNPTMQVTKLLPENVSMTLILGRVNELANSASVFVKIENETFPNQDVGHQVREVCIDLDTFALKNGQIRYVRELIHNAYTREEQVLQEIELYKNKVDKLKESIEFYTDRMDYLIDTFPNQERLKEAA